MNIEISKIKHPNLDGLDPDVIGQIAVSIDAFGLIHPITVRSLEDGTYELTAGKKRLKAVMDLGHTVIDAKVLEITKDKAQEMSLHENLRRANLPWYEIVELEAQLHEKRIAEHGQRKSGRPSLQDNGKGWSLSDTAEELGRAIGAVSQDLMLAMVLKQNPHLKNVQDKATALKLARQIAKREQAEIEALDNLNMTIFDQVYHGNSLDILATFPDNTFDVCVTDPPWTQYKDDNLTADTYTLPVFEQIYRVLKFDALLVMVVSTPDFYMYYQELPKFGFKVQMWPIIWHKESNITRGKRGWEYARDYEPILIAAKGNPVLTSATELSSVISVPAVRPGNLVHPHEKPVELITKLLKDTSYEGAKVLEPFGGSGVLGEACKKLNRRYTIIERNRKFYEQIVRRLEPAEGNSEHS